MVFVLPVVIFYSDIHERTERQTELNTIQGPGLISEWFVWFVIIRLCVCLSVSLRGCFLLIVGLIFPPRCPLPPRPKVGIQRSSLPIKLQSANEDGVRHHITSNILSHTRARLRQPQIGLRIKALKTGEVALPDNQITSCLCLYPLFQLGSNFLPSLDVRGGLVEFSGLRPFRSPFRRGLVIKRGWWDLVSLRVCFGLIHVW